MAALRTIVLESSSDFALGARWSRTVDGVRTPYPINDAWMAVQNAAGEVLLSATLGNGRMTIDGDYFARVLIDAEDIAALEHPAGEDTRWHLVVVRTADEFQKRLFRGAAVFQGAFE